MSHSLVLQMRARRDDLRSELAGVSRQMSDLVSTAEKRNDGRMLASETRAFDKLNTRARGLKTELTEAEDRIDELVDQAASEDRAAANRREYGQPGEQRSGPSWTVTREEATYRPDSRLSFFADAVNARKGDASAIERLARNNAERAAESRALGNTSGTGGSGGELAPPAWLVDRFVQLARPGRVTADLFHKEKLPDGVSTINLPKITGGSQALIQTTQNSTVGSVDITTAALTSNVTTIFGKQVFSRQLMDQSAIPFDEVVLQDLAADYARQVGVQAIIGTGTAGQLKGYLTPTSPNALTWTQASPTAAGFFAQLAKLQGQIAASRYASPDTVVLHPRRWAWLASYQDSTGRPLVAPTAGSFNSLAQADAPHAMGKVGSLLGMDVFVDPSIPVTQGTGTNQDVVLMFVRDDVWLWESDLHVEAWEAPYAESMGILARCFGYLACIPDRYPASLGSLSGSGLVTPTFAS